MSLAAGLGAVPDWIGVKRQIELEQAAAQRAQPDVPGFIPPFAYERNLHNFDANWTLVGLLWVRLARHSVRQQGAAVTAPIKFAVGRVSVIDAIEATHEGSRAVAVIVLQDGAAMILHDDFNLFPSDTLVGKIITLKDA